MTSARLPQGNTQLGGTRFHDSGFGRTLANSPAVPPSNSYTRRSSSSAATDLPISSTKGGARPGNLIQATSAVITLVLPPLARSEYSTARYASECAGKLNQR